MKIFDKTILLTGASGGIGQAIAKELAERGAKLLLTGRKLESLTALKNQLAHPEKHKIIIADITNDKGRQILFNHCLSETQDDGKQGIDILINNAGISEFEFLENQSDASIENIINTNLTSPILLSKLLLPLLKSKSQAALVNIGSSFGSIGYPGFSTYCSSKFGLHGFTEALRRELSDSNIKVSYLAPRATNTSINNNNVVSMNKKLGNAMDDPHVVALAVVKTIEKETIKDKFIGWPEKLFVRINALIPALVDSNLKKQLITIRYYANTNANTKS